MNWRFRKRIKIVPGVHINLSKGPPSVSIGEGPFTINVNKKGVRGTASLRGSGLSINQQVPWENPAPRKSWWEWLFGK